MIHLPGGTGCSMLDILYTILGAGAGILVPTLHYIVGSREPLEM